MMNGLILMMNGKPIPFIQKSVPQPLHSLKYILEMLKIHLCLYIGLSAVFGHVMAQQDFISESLLFGFFVFILACGSADLNNIQDRTYDLFFQRTVNRSLPQKRVTLFTAKLIAVLMIGCGLLGVFLIGGAISFFWGLMAVICYNVIYTPLKKRSLLAIFPGSLCGMIPPLMGWTATGMAVSDFSILLIMSIFGLWQMAHFFILLLKTSNLHPESIEMNKFPSFTSFFTQKEIKLQALIWTSFYSLSLLLFLMNGLLKNDLLSIFFGLMAVGTTLVISSLLFRNKNQDRSIAFAIINLSMLFFMGISICDKCFL